MKRFAASLVALATLTVGARAYAQPGWEITFSPQSIAAIGAPVQNVVVVAAGAQAPGAPAVVALMNGLRAAGRSTMVMDAGSLGDLSALDDRTIVARAASLPISTVAIVRTYPNGAGQESVVVMMYDKAANPLGAWSGQRGTLLAAAAEAPPVVSTPPAYTTYPTPISPVPSGTAPELTQQPGTVPVTFASLGKPLQLNAFSGSVYGVVSGYYRAYAVNLYTFRPLCQTPCTLYLPPGPQELRVTGVGIRQHSASFSVPPGGVDLRLRAPSAGGFIGGYMLTFGGVAVFVAGIVTLAIGETTSTITQCIAFSCPDIVTTQQHNHGLIVGGGVMLGLGLAMTGGGIALLAVNRGGVASATPHSPQAPTAKLSVGLGNLQVRGTF